MKKVTDLKENECISFKNKEEFKSILELNPKNDCNIKSFEKYGSNIVYYPTLNDNSGELDYISKAKSQNHTIHPASDFLQTTYQLTKSQIIEIAENGSLVKELFPDCFEVELEVGKWYKLISNQKVIVFYKTKCDNYEDKNGYGFNVYSEFIESNWTLWNCPTDWTLATPEEVEMAFKNYFIEEGFKKGVRVKCAKDNTEWALKLNPYDSDMNYGFKSITDGSGAYWFYEGKMAEILQNQNDVIKLIEVHGKDKLITLIEAYEPV